MKGFIQTSVVISLAGGLFGIFAWTYSQFSTVTAKAAATDIQLSSVTQQSKDIDTRLERIENKVDRILLK